MNYEIAFTDGLGQAAAGASLEVTVVDDAPLADPNSNSVDEGAVLDVSAEDGVLKSDQIGADGPSNGWITGVAFGDQGEDVSGDVGVAIEGTYGTLVLNADGSYLYTAKAGLEAGGVDAFTYTITDADGDTATTTLSITVDDIAGPTLDLGDGTLSVNEAYLPDGTLRTDYSSSEGQLTASGSFTITAPGGLGTLAIDGVELLTDGAWGGGSIEIPASEGSENVLRVTDVSETEPGSGVWTVSYVFELNEAKAHLDGDTPLDDLLVNYEIAFTDGLGQAAAGASLEVTVFDDAPLLDIRDGIFQNTADTLLFGTFAKMGADGGGQVTLTGVSVEFTGSESNTLTSGGVPLVYSGLGTSMITATAGDGGPLVFTMEAKLDGSYTFIQHAPVDLSRLDVDTVAEGSAGGPKDAYYIYEDGSFGSDPNKDWLVEITASGGGELVNANNNQLGVGTANFNDGQSILLNFDDAGDSGAANEVFTAQVGFNKFDTGIVSYTIYYANGASSPLTGSITPDDLDSEGFFALPVSPDGLLVDKIELAASGTNQSMGVSGINTFVLDDIGAADINFDFDAIDADGDDVSGSIMLTAQNSGVIMGTEENNALAGGSGNNEIRGGDGDDILIGGAGDDILYGGAGADTFAWSFGQDGDQGTTDSPAQDVVMDFSVGEGDTLTISELLSGLPQDAGQDDYILAEESEGGILLHISTSGGLSLGGDGEITGADQTILLNNVDTGGLSASDYLNSLIENGQLDID
ncbi:VCBS repeat-containing protein [Halomonas campaniensis]|uniref:VCBS repeat-containing protein n=1 Tax=Halomonas campaniensis TaxID=213554 RepID=A0A7W5JZR6_9GAMM|nr:VCBS repeat-containing protein [Halomonas campaniensis]